MKRISTLVSLISFVALMGCTKSPDAINSQDGPVAVNVGANISKTRAVDVMWNNNDLIGITMFTDGTLNLAEGNFRNCEYIIPIGSSGKFKPYNDPNTIYFPKDGSMVNFMAYYPYNPALTNTYIAPIDVSSQTNLPAIDFMTADRTARYSKDHPNVDLSFHHRLTKVTIVLQTQTGDDPTRLINSRIRIEGMLTKATYNLVGVNPAVVVDQTSGDVLSFVSDATGSQAKGIVLPRPAGAGVTFDVQLTDGSYYKGSMAADLELLSGYQYTFYLSLRKTSIDVSAEIKPWNVGIDQRYTAISVTTPVNSSVNVPQNAQMNVYSAGNLLTTYTYSGTTWTTTTPFFWENLVGVSVTFGASITPTPALNNSQLPDFLVADPITVPRDNGINFVIRHVATKVNVVLTSTDNSFNSTELTSATVTLPGYTGGGNVVNGVFVPGSSTGDILLAGNVAIFQPQTIAANANLVVVTINNKNYYIKAPAAGVQYVAGQAVTLNIDMKKTNIAVSASIVDWTTGVPIDLTGRYVTVTVPANTTQFLPSNVINFFILNNNLNTKFTYFGTNSWVPTTPLYWDALTTFPLQIAAVYPDNNIYPNQTGIYAWSVEGNQSTGIAKSDLLVAYQASVANGAAAVLNFKHAMNKINIILVPGDGFAANELNSATVVIKNMYTSCNVNLTNLVMTDLSDQENITPYQTSNLNFSALVVPCSLTAGTVILEVTVANKVYPVSLTANMDFLTTQYNTLTVRVNKTPIGLTCSISDWSQGQNGNYIIQ